MGSQTVRTIFGGYDTGSNLADAICTDVISGENRHQSFHSDPPSVLETDGRKHLLPFQSTCLDFLSSLR